MNDLGWLLALLLIVVGLAVIALSFALAIGGIQVEITTKRTEPSKSKEGS